MIIYLFITSNKCSFFFTFYSPREKNKFHKNKLLNCVEKKIIYKKNIYINIYTPPEYQIHIYDVWRIIWHRLLKIQLYR